MYPLDFAINFTNVCLESGIYRILYLYKFLSPFFYYYHYLTKIRGFTGTPDPLPPLPHPSVTHRLWYFYNWSTMLFSYLSQCITTEHVTTLCRITADTSCEAAKVKLLSILGIIGKMAGKKDNTLEVLKVRWFFYFPSQGYHFERLAHSA